MGILNFFGKNNTRNSGNDVFVSGNNSQVIINGKIVSGNSNCIEGNGKTIHSNINVGYEQFNQIHNSGSFKVYVNRNNNPTVSVDIESNLLEFLDIYIKGGIMYIGLKDGAYINYTKDINIYINSKYDIEYIKSSGSGRMEVYKVLATNSEIKNSGSGRLIIEQCSIDTLAITASGSGGILLSETTYINSANINLSGSGKFEGFNIQDIDVKLSGSGTVKISGRTNILSEKVSGSGKIVKR